MHKKGRCNSTYEQSHSLDLMNSNFNSDGLIRSNNLHFLCVMHISSVTLPFPSPPLHSKVSLYLRLHVECSTVTMNTPNVWRSHVIEVIAHLAMDSGMVAEVKEGLEFGCQIHLPPNITFSPVLLTDLFAYEGNVRPFHHLR